MKYLLLFENFDTKSHLKERGIDPDKTQLIIDEESGDTFFFLYNFSGQMVGYQKYNPKWPKSGQDRKKLGDPRKTKYYNWVGDEPEGKKIAVWGLESISITDKYIFITEGIFDIARAHEAGFPGVAVLCNDPNPQLGFWLKTLPQTKIVIYDNDVNKAGEKLIKLGDYAFCVPKGKDLNDLPPDDAKKFLQSCISKIENGVSESNAYSLEEYTSYITTGLGGFDLRPAQVNHLVDFYSDDIEAGFESGEVPKTVLDKIANELGLGKGTGFPSVKIASNSIRQLKYL
jgi:hypothetical protein